MNYRDSESKDDSWISHLGSWIDDAAINSRRKLRHFGFGCEGRR